MFMNGLKAIRVLKLAKNSVQFEIVSTETYTGFVEKEASVGETGGESSSEGVIRYETTAANSSQMVTKKIVFSLPRFNDKNNNSSAKNGNAIVVANSNRSSSISSSNSSGKFFLCFQTFTKKYYLLG